MKKFYAILLVVLMVLMTGCGSPSTGDASSAANVDAESTNAILSEEDIYQKLLARLTKKFNDVVRDDTHLDGFGLMEGMYGINEIAVQSRVELLSKIGYAITDINDDGISEFLVCAIDELTDEKCVGSRILCAYTVIENEASVIIVGSEKQRYYLLDDSSVYYEVLEDSENMGFAVYKMEVGTGVISCVDCYFADSGSEQGMAFYLNHSGEWDPTVSETFEGDLDSFLKVSEELAARIKTVELLSFPCDED